MAWFNRKPKKEPVNILEQLEEPAPSTAPPLLQGDENATTPVEGDALGKMARLHPFSPVALALLKLFDSEDADINKVVEMIGSDATLATETLAYVNSALFGLREPITNLRHAIAVMGSENAHSLTTTLAMRSMCESAPKPAVVRRIWKHSVATAIIASELAPIYGVQPGLASAAGILHDVGRMGLLAQYREMYPPVVMSLFNDVDSILAEERQICALDHCDVGYLLGQAWKLPEIFQQVAAQHHKVTGGAGVLGLIHDACELADTLGYAAIAYRNIPVTAEWLENRAPAPFRQQIAKHWAGVSQRIVEKIEILDF